MKLKKRISIIILVAICCNLLSCGDMNTEGKVGVNQKIRVLLTREYYINSVGILLEEEYPDVEFEFIMGRRGVDYIKKAAENDFLPDILITDMCNPQNQVKVSEYLYDFNGTDVIANFPRVYLENYRESDTSIKWLPGTVAIEGVMANKDLFEAYNVDIPTDYDSFLSACEAFEKEGIRGYESDFVYDYTTAFLLQAWSIPLLQSPKGLAWRHDQDTEETVELPDEIGIEMFEKLAEVMEAGGLEEGDENLGYVDVFDDFTNGRVAMIRQSTNMADYENAGMKNLILLPYFGETQNDNWYFTTPSYGVAVNAKVGEDSEKEALVLDIVSTLFGQECMNAFAKPANAFACYSDGVEFEYDEKWSNVIDYVETNHMYTYLNGNKIAEASYESVQRMIKEDLTAKEALDIFNEVYVAEEEEPLDVATIENGYLYEFTEHGSEAFSARVNTLRALSGDELLLAHSVMNTSDIYEGSYTEKELNNLIQAGGIRFNRKDSITGKELREVVRCAVEGCGTLFDPISLSTLPASSGFEMVISEDENGKFHLEDITIDGKSIQDDDTYSFCYVGTNGFGFLEAAYQYNVEENDGLSIMLPDNAKVNWQEFEGYRYLETDNDQGLIQLWRDYFIEGNEFALPTPYITINAFE